MKFFNAFFIHRRVQSLLALYTDGELPQDEAAHVRQHLDACAKCRRVLANIVDCRELLKVGAAPQIVPTEQLWQRIIRNVVAPRHARLAFRVLFSTIDFRYLRWPIAVALVFLSLAIWKGTNLIRQNQTRSSAIDYSIFLDDVRLDFSSGNFYKRYRAQLASLDEAQQSISFPLAAIDALPESYRLECVRLFECNGQKCILFSCIVDGKTINIFQHALGQAWTLGKYAVSRTPICNVECLLVNTTEVAALSWQGKNSEYLAVGDFTPQEIEKVVHVLQ